MELRDRRGRLKMLQGLIGTASAMLVSAESWAGDKDCMLLPILQVMIQLQERVSEDDGTNVLDPGFVEDCKVRVSQIQYETA